MLLMDPFSSRLSVDASAASVGYKMEHIFLGKYLLKIIPILIRLQLVTFFGAKSMKQHFNSFNWFWGWRGDTLQYHNLLSFVIGAWT